MSDLVTLARAKTHLRVTNSNSDQEIQTLLDTAEALVCEYIDIASVSALGSPIPDDTFTLEAAILLTLTNLYDERNANPLNRAVTDLLRRWRQPVIG